MDVISSLSFVLFADAFVHNIYGASRFENKLVLKWEGERKKENGIHKLKTSKQQAFSCPLFSLCDDLSFSFFFSS